MTLSTKRHLPVAVCLVVACLTSIAAIEQSSAAEKRCRGGVDLGQGAEPAWSPDGRRIAFVKDNAVWVVNVDGSNARCLTRPGVDQSDSSPSWSPNQRQVVFARFSAPANGRTRSDLYVAQSDSAEIELVSAHLPRMSVQPRWFPGHHILFVGDCRLVRVTGGGTGRQVIALPSVHCVSTPTWSRNDKSIVFSAVGLPAGVRRPDPSLWSVGPRGEKLKRLTRGFDDRDPDVSPDGRVIAMSRNCRIALLNRTTSTARFLTSESLANFRCARSPEWSRDEGEIVYSVGSTVFVMQADGTDKRRVVGPRR
jgi:Tol biopolymer transport system component